MRLLDGISDKPLKNIHLLLTLEEARELVDSLNILIKNPDNNHTHLNDAEFERELTVSIYSSQNMQCFEDRFKRLIIDGE